MIDQADVDPRFWEPGPPLRVGDRVRVRLSGECPGWSACAHECHTHPHLAPNGSVGTVADAVHGDDRNERTFRDGHYYLLRADDEQHLDDWFAPIELERLR